MRRQPLLQPLLIKTVITLTMQTVGTKIGTMIMINNQQHQEVKQTLMEKSEDE
jgi:hypothetical protein